MESLLGVLTDLNQLIPILIHWLHLLSAVVWIGGLAFLVMAVTPCLKTAVPKELIKPISEAFYRQYKRVVGVLLVVILFTGGLNLHYVSEAMILATGESVAHHGFRRTTQSYPVFSTSHGEKGCGTACRRTENIGRNH